MGRKIEEFRSERERLNKLVLSTKDIHIKRFFALDNAVYHDGALPAKTKELLGLVASMVLRCDDCISYHINQCFEGGLNRAELDEALGVALVVGGSIVIPHMRRACELWDELEKQRVDESV